jgi:hypothetical protein
VSDGDSDDESREEVGREVEEPLVAVIAHLGASPEPSGANDMLEHFNAEAVSLVHINHLDRTLPLRPFLDQSWPSAVLH